MEQGTSQPEAVRALGEKSVVVIDREAGFPDSHQVRPVHGQHGGEEGRASYALRCFQDTYSLPKYPWTFVGD